MRFPEFQGEWRKVRFSEIGDFFKGAGISKDQVSEDGNPCILYGELYTKYKNEIIKKVASKTNIDVRGLVRSKTNDIIIPSSGESAEDIATACCVNLDDILLGGDLNVIRPYTDNGNFISYQLNGKRKLDVAKIAQGSSVIHLYNNSLKTLQIHLPHNLDEQNKIALLLSVLDTRIETQNKIIEEFDTLLKSISYNLFSKKVRFVDADGRTFPNWKIKKLEQVFNYEKGKGVSKDKVVQNGIYKCILYGELYTKYNEVINEVISSTNVLDGTKSKIGDLLIPCSTTTTGIDLANVTALNKKDVLLGGDITILRSKFEVNNVFYSYYLSHFKKEEIASYAQGSTIVHLYYSHFKKIYIDVPCLEEQTRIADCLGSINNKILLEKKLLEKYKSQKNFFLKNLFI